MADPTLKLSSDEAARAKQLFKKIDLNDSGQISRREAIKCLGVEQGAETFDLLDADRDGFVDQREWKRFLRSVKREKGVDAFTTWMNDMEQLVQSTSAARAEEKAAKEKLRRAGPPKISPQRARGDDKQANLTHRQTKAALVLFQSIDLDKSGMISYSELKEASMDDTMWRNLDVDLNGDVGLHEWMTFLRRTKMDRGSKGLNHWMVDIELVIAGEQGCGVKAALYESFTEDTEEDMIPLGEGLRMSEMKGTSTNNVLSAGQRDTGLKVFKAMDLDRSGQIEYKELVSVAGEQTAVDLTIDMDIPETEREGTHISMHMWVSALRIKKRDLDNQEKFEEWLEELEQQAQHASRQRKKELLHIAEVQRRKEAARRAERAEEATEDPNANKLTEVQRARSMALFNGIDTDKNGSLEEHELQRACGDMTDQVFAYDGDGNNRVDMTEWLRYLRTAKQKNGGAWLDSLLLTIEENAGLIREEKKAVPVYNTEQLESMTSNLFKYRLSEEEELLARDMWPRFDPSKRGWVLWADMVRMWPDEDVAGLPDEEAEDEMRAANEALSLLERDSQGRVTRNEWLRFMRRLKQQSGSEGVLEVLDRYDVKLPGLVGEYSVETSINQYANKMKALRKARKQELFPRDLSYPKTSPYPVKPRSPPAKKGTAIAVYLFENDGVHAGAGELCTVTGGVHELLRQASVVLGKPIHRLFGIQGAEITGGAGTSCYKLTPGMEVVAGGTEGYLPKDERSLETLKLADPNSWATITDNQERANRKDRKEQEMLEDQEFYEERVDDGEPEYE